MEKTLKKFSINKSKVILTSILFIFLISNTKLYAEERQGLLLNAGLSIEHDDNVLRQIEPISDTSVYLSPELQYFTHIGKHSFAINYQGKLAAFKENTKLNHNNHDLALLARLDHSLKINSEFKLSYKNEIEEPGINNSNTLLFTEFNQTNKKQAAAKIYYGTKESIGQLVLSFEHAQNRYDNNSQEYRDVDRNRLTGTFYYRIAPKTRFLFQASIGDYDYIIKNQFPDQSSKETFFLTGVQWDITAKTSGTFKIGYQGKNFEQDVYNDITGLSYMLDMTWKPNTYTDINIGASKLTRESSQLLTSAFVSNSYTIDANHKITPRTTLKAGYTFDNDDIVTRSDKRHKVTLGVEHSLRTWLNIGLNYRYLERRSDFAIYEFKSNIIGLSLTTTFN